MIREIKNVLTNKECNILINYARQHLEKSNVVQTDTKDEEKDSPVRTSSSCTISNEHCKNNTEISELNDKIKRKISDITELPCENQETLQILNYQVGEHYAPHYDYFPKGTLYWENAKKFGGERVFSILIYLNDVEKGGWTVYPNLRKSITPEIGKLLLHQNYKDGQQLEESFHGSYPVIKGEKWALVCWIRENKWKPNY